MPSKAVSVTIPGAMLPAIDAAARRERRSRSELIREALQRYLAAGRGGVIPLDDAQPDEIEAVHKGRGEFERGEFVRLEVNWDYLLA
ncbi:MAG TPA: ribbon-helix-helix protein, CopG family, partial [Stellaceae bacterium]